MPPDTTARRCGSATGSERTTRLLISEKSAMFAPMPNASDRMATMVTIGVAARLRTARRRLCNPLSW
jgi:hypothetical protein